MLEGSCQVAASRMWMYVCVDVCMCVYMYVCVDVCMCGCMYVWMYVFVDVVTKEVAKSLQAVCGCVRVCRCSVYVVLFCF
jgi:hypothetical protein